MIPNEFEIINDVVKIQLTQGKYGYCDLQDWNELKKYRWFTSFNKKTRKYYIVSNIEINGKIKTILIHRLITNPLNGLVVNHIDNDGFNNRRNNLEVCTHQENCRYCQKPINNTSGYKGVTWSKAENKWYANIKVNKKKIWLGGFVNIIDAARAYNEAATKYFGKFAILNIISNQI